ncbi:MAG: segregation/condensation protein A [Planctomycetes bacterium]|nr:segregation/condensation protein A [Planctomycetota bacterium]
MNLEVDYSPYRIQIETFSGPMDLLLYLIRREEVEIADIPIARIADQYLEYLETIEDLDLSLAGDFLLLAATLMEIKSRMLLPQEEQVADSDEDEDPRSELIQRLIEYKRFKDAARFLQGRGAVREQMFPRPDAVVEIPKEWSEEELLKQDPLEGVTLWDLLNAFTRVLKRTKPFVQAKVTYEEIPLQAFFHRIMQFLRSKPTCAFEELFLEGRDRNQVIGTFLALLELIRLKKVRVRQTEPFGTIWVEWVAGSALSDEEADQASAQFEFRPEDQPTYEGALDLAGRAERGPDEGEQPRSRATSIPAAEADVHIETLRSRHVTTSDDGAAEASATPLPGFATSSSFTPQVSLFAGPSSSPPPDAEDDVEEFGEEDEIDRALSEVVIPDVQREAIFPVRPEKAGEAPQEPAPETPHSDPGVEKTGPGPQPSE